MRSRCNDPNHYAYPQYGGRGIHVSSEWDSFSSFLEWAVNNGYVSGLTLERIDNNGDYSPDNCRWATWKEQGNNRRTNVLITFNGKTQTMAMWAKEIGISREALWVRLRRSTMTLEEALTAPKGSITRWNKKEMN